MSAANTAAPSHGAAAPAGAPTGASLTLCLSPARVKELKAELEQLEQQWLQRYGSDDATQVVQLNVQMFPLSRAKE